MVDLFDPAALLRRMLAGLGGIPVRCREVAGAEEDLVRGGYRQRLVVERAHTAADAAMRARRPSGLGALVRIDAVIRSGIAASTRTSAMGCGAFARSPPALPEWAVQGDRRGERARPCLVRSSPRSQPDPSPSSPVLVLR